MSKLQKLREYMKSSNLDAVMVLDELNQRYLSEFSFTDGFLLITAKSAYLVTDFRYYEMALNKACSDFKVITPDDRTKFMEQVFSDEECKTVGLEGGFVSFDYYNQLCSKHKRVEFVSIGDAIELIRQLKCEAEVELMQKAQDITDKAFSHILNVIKTDMTEIEVAAELEYAMRKNGADGLAFETIAVSGDASALPHGTPRNCKLKPGFLTMDFGARFDGYCSDMTRTIVIGKADNEIKKVYNTVLNAQRSALDILRAGVDCGEADKVARDIINKDYEGTFGHSLGHAVGLFIHEKPSLSFKSFGRALRSGEVVTVEPGIYLFGKYGCRIEDMVLIKENGIYNFTKSKKDLIEIY